MRRIGDINEPVSFDLLAAKAGPPFCFFVFGEYFLSSEALDPLNVRGESPPRLLLFFFFFSRL